MYSFLSHPTKQNVSHNVKLYLCGGEQITLVASDGVLLIIIFSFFKIFFQSSIINLIENLAVPRIINSRVLFPVLFPQIVLQRH